MDNKYLLYREIYNGRLIVGTKPTARWGITIVGEVPREDRYRSCLICIKESPFEKAFLNKRACNEQQLIQLSQIKEKRFLLPFTVAKVKQKLLTLTNKDYKDCAFVLPASHHPILDFRSVIPGQTIQLFVSDTDSSPILLSYNYPQNPPQKEAEPLIVGTELVRMEIEEVYDDRLVVSHKGIYYTIPSDYLFYANTPLGMGYYEHQQDRKLSLYVIKRIKPGFYHLTDKCIPYESMGEFNADNAPMVGSLIRGIPIHYKDHIGIFVKIDSFIALMPRSLFHFVPWQSVPQYFPLGVEQEFEVATVSTKSKKARITLKPITTSAGTGKSVLQVSLLNDGEIYPVKLFKCHKSEDGNNVLYLKGICKSEMCYLYPNSVPSRLYPFLEEMARQNCIIHLCINRISNRYICSWPSYVKSRQEIPKGLQPFKVVCTINRLALLTMNNWWAVHLFRVWELWHLKRSKLKNGDIVLMQYLGVCHDGLLNIAFNDNDIWERCLWKVGDTLQPLGRANDNGILICDCNGIPGMLLPTGSSFRMGQTVTVIYVNKTLHILIVTTQPDLFTFDNNTQGGGKTIIGDKLRYLGESLLIINTKKKTILVIEEPKVSTFLYFFVNHKLLFESPLPTFVTYVYEDTNYICAKWTGLIGEEDYTDMTNGKEIIIELCNRREDGDWDVCYRHLKGIFHGGTSGEQQNGRRLISAKWNGCITPDGNLFEFVPYTPSVHVGEKISIRQLTDGKWYYDNFLVTIDWGLPIFSNIDNYLLAKPLMSLEVDVISSDNALCVDGSSGLRHRYENAKWDDHDVIVDFFVVGKKNDSTLILAGNSGAGTLLISDLEKSVTKNNIPLWCQEGTLIPVKQQSRDSSGLMNLVPARSLDTNHHSIERESYDNETSIGGRLFDNCGYYFLKQPWKECPLEVGDHLWAEIINIEKGIMTVKWQSVCIAIRRKDAVPQQHFRPGEIYEVGQIVECVIKKFCPENNLFFLKVYHDTSIIRQKIDFKVGQVVDVSVVRADSQITIVTHNGVRGVVHNDSKSIRIYKPNDHLSVRCLSIDFDNLAIEFGYESEVTEIECVVSKKRKNSSLKVIYKDVLFKLETGKIPTCAFVQGDKVWGSFMESGRITLTKFRKSLTLQGEIISGVVIKSNMRGIVIEMDDGTRGIIYNEKQANNENFLKLCKKYQKGTRVERARCIWVNAEMGIARLSLSNNELQERYVGLEINQKVTFTVHRIDTNALHGYVDNLYAIINRQEAGWKYNISDDYSLKAEFSIGSRLNARIISIPDRLELSLKRSAEEYSIALQIGNIIKGKIVRYILCPEDWHLSYYLLEWDEYVGILPLRESSYQAFPPLLYLHGEEVSAIIVNSTNNNMPILSVCRCHPNPLLYSSLKKGECYKVQLIGINNGCLIMTLPKGIRTSINIKKCFSTRSQYDYFIVQHDIMVRIIDIQGKIYTIELAQSFPMGTSLLKGTKIKVTIFQIETTQNGIRGYDAFSDEGLLLWIPFNQESDNRVNHIYQNEISVGDRFIARLTTNPGDTLVKAVLIESIN